MAAEADWKNAVFKDQMKEFCCITNAKPDIAKIFLKRNDFILQEALHDYFENGESVDNISKDEEENDSAESASTERRKKFTLLTWNIDGLDEEDLYLRVLSVSETINSLDPDVVYLQEVVDKSLEILKKSCKRYEIYHHAMAHYYCAIMIKKEQSISYMAQDITEYPTTRMGRYLLHIDIFYEGRPISLFTTHLESTKPAKSERIKQLQFCFQQMLDIGQDSSVILAGDLNLRDDEVAKIGGLPSSIKDAWVEMGSDTMHKFSWDLSLNDNKTMPGNGKPKCRFDRVFYRAPQDGKLKISDFKFVGKQRLGSCDRFASDHWGILCDFIIDG